MGWTNIFKSEPVKPTNVYQSNFFEDYLEQRGLRDSSKSTYRGYRDAFVHWLDVNNIAVPAVEDCKQYLVEKRNVTNGKQAKARYDLFAAYCDWLVENGKLSANPWKAIDLDEIRITGQFTRAKRKPIVPKATFTLSEVAELLLAIEDNDDKAIAKVLEGESDGK